MTVVLMMALYALLGCVPASGWTPQAGAATAEPVTTFAVIGDNGTANEAEAQVARLVASWQPEFIINLGDAYYSIAGGAGTEKYDRTTGAYFCAFLKDVKTTGSRCPHGQADRNRFFPAIGNHEYDEASLETYLDYFTLPGADFENSSPNERYYDFRWGPLHFFVLNSDGREPDGVTADSVQAQWLEQALGESTSPWNLVYFHHPPYSSGATHGSFIHMRWPFREWGADAVLVGHEHLYERIMAEGIVYFVNGLGGAATYPFAARPLEGSAARVTGAWGAQKVTATDTAITFQFFTADGALKDSYTIEKPQPGATNRLNLPMVLAP